ncbi:hypothetical protein ACLFKQ_09710 [Myxosarcina sp. GI1(2024)]
MPRLKRIKVQKLYRPHAGQTNAYPNLEPVMREFLGYRNH